jgi:hypothetical protein
MLLAVITFAIPNVQAQYGPRTYSPPGVGTFFSLFNGGTNAPPTPFLPYDPIDVAVYPILQRTNCFVYDDWEIGLFMANNPEPPPPPGEGSEDTNSFSPAYIDYDVDDLWLEIYAVDWPNLTSLLALHGTKPNVYYELQEKPNLDRVSWEFSPVDILFNSTGTNLLHFDPTPNGGRLTGFYRAVEGFPVVWVESDRNFNVPREPNPATSDDGQIGIFNFALSDVLSSNLTVIYTLSGTAINGDDYTSLPGTVTVLAGTQITNIIIEPREDSIVEFQEPVTITLVLTNGYLIDPTRAKATMFITDNETCPFQTVATNVPAPVGIDYNPALQSLIVSVNFNTGTDE